MNDLLRALLGLDPRDESLPAVADRKLLAAAALMVEAARLDGRFDEAERAGILRLLTGRFAFPPDAADRLLADAEERAKTSVDLHGFTSAIKDGFDHAGRVELLEMLWRVVHADGELHDLEASLMRRVAALLYVGDGESAEARARALGRDAAGPRAGASPPP